LGVGPYDENTVLEKGSVQRKVSIGGCATLKMLRRKSKTQLANHERNTQNAIALLNYLQRIVPHRLLLRTQVFTQKF
jgi:hypothetical protein